MHSIGIMLGRLSPAVDKRLQFFPTNWEAEFPLAKEMGFSSITWALDRDIPGFDPINDIWVQDATLSRIDAAREILPIDSIDCNLYPMFGEGIEKTLVDFRSLLPALASRLSTKIVVIPLLIHTAPKTEDKKRETAQTLRDLIAIAEPLGLRIALETEMPADELLSYVDSFGSASIGVCYDIGNCTSYGFDCAADIRALGKRILDVHFKDRKVGSEQSMLLGTGDADFDACFEALKGIEYEGPYTLQAWRGENYLEDARTQLAFVKNKLNTAYGA